MRTTSRAFAIVFVTAVGLSAQTRAASVSNGDFETGDFTGWTQGGDTTFTFVISAAELTPHGGNYAAALGPSDFGTLSQTIDVTAGTAYRLSFWLLNLSDSTPIDFAVEFGANRLSLPYVPPASTYLQFTIDASAATDALTVTFSFRNDPAYWLLDDIQVEALPTPLPPAVFLAVPALGTLLGRRRRAPA